MELNEAVRIVREQLIPSLSEPGWAQCVEAAQTVLAALSRRSEEWDAVVAALGPHAHPGLSPSESVASVVALLADETEMVVGPDGPRAKRSPYLHWRRRAEKAEAALEAAGAWREDRAAVCEGRETAIRERDEARADAALRRALAEATQLEANRLADALAAEREKADDQFARGGQLERGQ